MGKHKIDIGFVSIEVVLAFIQVYSDLAIKLFESEDAAAQTLFPIQFIFLIFYITLKMIDNGNTSETALSEIKQGTESVTAEVQRFLDTKAEVKALSPEAFYHKFEGAVLSAQSFVGISHFDVAPPDHLEGTCAGNYYSKLEKYIKDQRRVSFRRVERVTPEKREWIESLVETYKGVRNFSLSCYMTNEMSPSLPAISTQVVDRDKVFLVAIAKQSVLDGGYRDIYIKDREIHDLWQAYYDNVLFDNSDSLQVIKNGIVNQVNLDVVMKYIEEKS